MSDIDQAPGKAFAGQLLRGLPSVDRLLGHPALAGLSARFPHDIVTASAREVVDETRERILKGELEAVPALGRLAAMVEQRLQEHTSPSLRPAINATGVVIHTNLGRAPLSRAAQQAMLGVAAYSNLEYDLEQGERGSRYTHAVGILRQVTGCESALVVNNNAAGLVLALAALASGREAIVSRGQLVEIGGGFRIPEIMQQSGVRLVEVGTTNRTYLADYERAVTENTAAILRVHASNFRIVGFTATPTLPELAALAAERGLALLDDVGSGALLDTSRYGLAKEPVVQESLAEGAGLVLFSGDKLLGGPQCGVIAGKRELVDRLRRHPLARALRVDKLTLAALEATVLHYLKGEAEREVPVWHMISTTEEELQATATRWCARLLEAGLPAEVRPGRSAVGGGSLPGETLPTYLVAITPPGESAAAGQLAGALRLAPRPVVARVERGSLLVDPRTVLEGEEETLLSALVEAAQAIPGA